MNEKLEKLIKFMERKAHIIGHPKYFTSEVKEEMKKFEKNDNEKDSINIYHDYDNNVDFIYDKLIEAIYCFGLDKSLIGDGNLCPFCLEVKYRYSQKNIYCEKCSYAIFNGICYNKISTYSKIIAGQYNIINMMFKSYSPSALKNLFLYEIFHENEK